MGGRIVGLLERTVITCQRRWNGWWIIRESTEHHLHSTKGWRLVNRHRSERPTPKQAFKGRPAIAETYHRVGVRRVRA